MARPLTEPLEARLLFCGDVPAPDDPSEALPRNLTEWSATPKRVLYILARFPDQAMSAAPTPAAARGGMAQVDAIMRENSYGRVSIDAEVTGVVVLPRPMAGPGSYAESDWQQVLVDARDAAAAEAGSLPGPSAGPDWDYRHYDLYTVRYNGGPGDFPGAAPVRSRRSWLKDDSPWVAAHEFGHNLGLWHANALIPDDLQTTTGRGRNDEYGNPFDVMGRSRDGAPAFNVWERHRLGWLPDPYVATASATDAVHTYTLYPFDTTNHPRPGRSYAIRVRKDGDAFNPGDRREYWIGFRQDEAWTRPGTGADPNPTFNPGLAAGVEINWCAWGPAGSTVEGQTTAGSNGGSQLLDMTPQTPAASPEAAGRRDSALAVGRTFSDTIAGVNVTPLRMRADGGIDVRVSFSDGSGSNAAPTASVSAGATVVAPGEPVLFRAAASDADGDALAFSWDFGDGTFAAGDGDGDGRPDAFDRAVATRWAKPGDYRVRVTVSDTNGGTASDSVMVRVAAAGTVPTTRRVTGTVRDMLGVPVPDVRVSDGPRSAYTDSDGSYTLSVPRAAPLRTLAASKPGWRFAPVPASQSSSLNFDGVEVGYHISGKVTDEAGAPLTGVLASVGVRSALTDADGEFLLPVGNGVYAVTFSKTGYTFPAGAPFTVEYADKSLNGVFFGNPTYVVAQEGAINGRVMGLSPDVPMQVTVNAESSAGARAADAIINFDYGRPFYVLRLPVGTWNVTATGVDAAGRRYSFSPAGWENPLAVSGSVQAVDFVIDFASAVDLVGQVVYADGVGVPGATVRVGGRKATTADDGRYVIHGLPPGEYPVLATKPGMRFRRGNAVVTDEGATASVVPATSGSPGNRAPAVFAVAQPPTVTYRGAWLTAAGVDDRPADHLRYTWSALFSPPGGGVTFGVNGRELNGTNAAQRVLAVFSKPGTYVLRVTATDEDGAVSRPAYVRVYVRPT